MTTVQVIYTDGYTRYFGHASTEELKIAKDDRLYISIYGNVFVVEEVLSYASAY